MALSIFLADKVQTWKCFNTTRPNPQKPNYFSARCVVISL